MSNLALNILKWVLIPIIIIGLPTAAIYYDYSNDIQQNQDQLQPYDTKMGTNNSTIAFELGNFPRLTDVNTFSELSSSVPTMVRIYIIEARQYDKFLSGSIPESQLTTILVNATDYAGWFNTTVVSDGTTRLVFEGINLTGVVDISGYYNFRTQSYFSRNAFSIFFSVGLYILITLGVIPRSIRRYKINKMKARKQEERMREEEEYYTRRNRNK